MGEGEGLGVKSSCILESICPLPLSPSHQGRGNLTFYECIKFVISKEFLRLRNLRFLPAVKMTE